MKIASRKSEKHLPLLNHRCLKERLRSIFRSLRLNVLRVKSISALILLFACGILVLCLYISNLLGPVGGSSLAEEMIRINPGMSAMEIGNLLEKKGFIKSPLLFRLASSVKGTNRSLKAGEYIVSADMGALQILDRIASGDSILYRFTIPVGLTLSQIAELWEWVGFGTKAVFVKASREPAMSKQNNINADNVIKMYEKIKNINFTAKKLYQKLCVT